MDNQLQQQLQLQLQLQLYHSIATLLQQQQQQSHQLANQPNQLDQQQQQQQQQNLASFQAQFGGQLSQFQLSPAHQQQANSQLNLSLNHLNQANLEQPLQLSHRQPHNSANLALNLEQHHQQQQHRANSTATTIPSCTLLAKLSAVTSREPQHQQAAQPQATNQLISVSTSMPFSELDRRIDELLCAFYSINDDPEPAAIEMIARRISATSESVADWFDKKRFKLNPNASSSSGAASPRSQTSGGNANSNSHNSNVSSNQNNGSAAKKREGGRVVTFSEYQRSLLEAIFEENNYLHPQEYEELSSLIQVPSRNIKIWFKNRRSKQRLTGRCSTTTTATTNNNPKRPPTANSNSNSKTN